MLVLSEPSPLPTLHACIVRAVSFTKVTCLYCQSSLLYQRYMHVLSEQSPLPKLHACIVRAVSFTNVTCMYCQSRLIYQVICMYCQSRLLYQRYMRVCQSRLLYQHYRHVLSEPWKLCHFPSDPLLLHLPRSLCVEERGKQLKCGSLLSFGYCAFLFVSFCFRGKMP